MIKKLIFPVTVLVPVFTVALSVPDPGYCRTKFTDTVTDPTVVDPIACDIGPSYTGQIPAGAQAAGFTHCAANYDFTSAAYANPATWLDCKGASSPQWTLYAQTCSHVVITTDGGTQVLDLQFDPNTDFANGLTTTSIQTSGSNNNSNISQALFTVPTGKYVEFVSRIESNTQANACPSHQCELNNIWSWGGNGNPNFIEWDFDENYPNSAGNGGIQHFWNGASGGLSNLREPGMTGYDPTQYHTYGFRITNDTSGNMAVCNYLDGTILDSRTQGSSYQCATGSYSPVPLGRDFLVLMDGPASGTNFSVTGHYYIKSLRVWDCPGYASGECYNSTAQVTNGGALTGPP